MDCLFPDAVIVVPFLSLRQDDDAQLEFRHTRILSIEDWPVLEWL